jgi:hypothetical protein
MPPMLETAATPWIKDVARRREIVRLESPSG